MFSLVTVGTAGILYQGMYAQNLVGAQVEMRSFEVRASGRSALYALKSGQGWRLHPGIPGMHKIYA